MPEESSPSEAVLKKRSDCREEFSEELFTERAKFRHWLESGEDGFKDLLDGREPNKNTIVHLAADQGKWEIIHDSLAFVNSHERIKALLFRRNEFGDTAIMLAADKSDSDTIDKMLYFLSDDSKYEDTCLELLLIQNVEKKQTALHRLFMSNSEDFDFETITSYLSRESLLKLLKVVDSKGCSAIHYAVEREHYAEITMKMLKGVPKGKAKEVLGICDKKQRTVVHFAAENGNVPCLRNMLQCVPDSYDKFELIKPKDGKYTALHSASYSGQSLCVDVILDEVMASKHYDLLAMVDEDGNTALHLAVMADDDIDDSDRSATVKSLLEDKRLTLLEQLQLCLSVNNDGHIPLNLAEERKNKEVRNCLLRSLSKLKGEALQTDLEELKKDEQLKSENKQVKEENKQVKEENKQVKEENKQVKEENKWLKEENEQVKEENELVKEESKRLKEENRWLKEENKQVKEENKQMKEENEQVKEENEQVKEENEQVKEESKRLKEKNKQVKEENKQVKEESERLKEENKQVKEESERLKEENKRLKEENKQVKEENIRLREENKQLKDRYELRDPDKKIKGYEVVTSSSDEEPCDNGADFTLTPIPSEVLEAAKRLCNGVGLLEKDYVVSRDAEVPNKFTVFGYGVGKIDDDAVQEENENLLDARLSLLGLPENGFAFTRQCVHGNHGIIQKYNPIGLARIWDFIVKASNQANEMVPYAVGPAHMLFTKGDNERLQAVRPQDRNALLEEILTTYFEEPTLNRYAVNCESPDDGCDAGIVDPGRIVEHVQRRPVYAYRYRIEQEFPGLEDDPVHYKHFLNDTVLFHIGDDTARRVDEMLFEWQPLRSFHVVPIRDLQTLTSYNNATRRNRIKVKDFSGYLYRNRLRPAEQRQLGFAHHFLFTLNAPRRLEEGDSGSIVYEVVRAEPTEKLRPLGLFVGFPDPAFNYPAGVHQALFLCKALEELERISPDIQGRLVPYARQVRPIYA